MCKESRLFFIINNYNVFKGKKRKTKRIKVYTVKEKEVDAQMDKKMNIENNLKAKQLSVYDLHGKTVDELLEITGQTDAIPINLKKILLTYNLFAIPHNFSENEKTFDKEYGNAKILGAVIITDRIKAILYNAKDKKDSHRYRFTVAHELAHCCLHGASSYVELRTEGIPLSQEEKEANIFAGALLVPENSLQKVVSQLIMPSVEDLAEIFNVSCNVMRERLKRTSFNKKIIGLE